MERMINVNMKRNNEMVEFAKSRLLEDLGDTPTNTITTKFKNDQGEDVIGTTTSRIVVKTRTTFGKVVKLNTRVTIALELIDTYSLNTSPNIKMTIPASKIDILGKNYMLKKVLNKLNRGKNQQYRVTSELEIFIEAQIDDFIKTVSNIDSPILSISTTISSSESNSIKLIKRDIREKVFNNDMEPIFKGESKEIIKEINVYYTDGKLCVKPYYKIGYIGEEGGNYFPIPVYEIPQEAYDEKMKYVTFGCETEEERKSLIEAMANLRQQ